METTLFDKSGKPIAYIAARENNSIYMWDGRAVCYLDNEKIFGWKGKHIGWFIEGVVYNTTGYKIGFTQQKCPSITYIEPVKYVKHVQYIKYVQYVPFIKPVLSSVIANDIFSDFLIQDSPY